MAQSHGANDNDISEKQFPTTTTHGTGSDDSLTPDKRPQLVRTATQRQWARNNQRAKLTWHLSWRLLISISLCAFVAMVLIIFEKFWIIPTNSKSLFNAAITGLSIGIGINIAAGLVQVAQYARWYLLSRKPLHADQFETVFECESQTETCGSCSANTPDGLPGLASPNENDSDHIGKHNGTSSVALLNPITDLATWANKKPAPIKDQQAQANIYGQQLTNFYQADATLPNFGNALDTLYYGKTTPTYPDQLSWYHFFTSVDATATGSAADSDLVTSRVVRSNASCAEWSVDSAEYLQASATVVISNEFHSYNISFVADVRDGDTTYLSFLDEESLIGLNSRSAQVIALVSRTDAYRAFVCNSSVSRVGEYNDALDGWVHEYKDGEIQDALQIPDEQARILAGGIGWPQNPPDDLFGSVTYPNSSFFGISETQTADNVANYILATFSMAAIGAMNNDAPRINVTKTETPQGGLTLVVTWNQAGAILAVIPFLHFVLIALVLWMARHVVMRPNSPFGTALLFRPLLEHIEHGAMLDSKDIIKMQNEEDKIVFTYELDQDGVAVLKAKRLNGPFEYQKFEDGYYK